MDYEKFIEYFNEHDVFSRESGIRLKKIGDGFAEAELDFSSRRANFMGTMHGGALFTMADVAAGSALLSHGSLCVTLNLSLIHI